MRMRALAGAAFGVLLVVQAGTLRGERDRSAEAGRIADLIRQLGDDDFERREAASEKLAAIGEPALPALRKAASTSADLEIRRRAQALIVKTGWVSLFNGKDLDGWKVFPRGTGRWKVEKGILSGSGETSHLFSERGDYQNFHFRIEATINDGGNSGQFFRTKFEPGHPSGYEAQINATHGDPVRTGSLYPRDDMWKIKELIVHKAPHRLDEWFTQEVIAVGDKITILVNGKKTVEWRDPKWRYKKGHFALQHHNPATVVRFRKVEVKPMK
jgi:hypothetical protein